MAPSSFDPAKLLEDGVMPGFVHAFDTYCRDPTTPAFKAIVSAFSAWANFTTFPTYPTTAASRRKILLALDATICYLCGNLPAAPSDSSRMKYVQREFQSLAADTALRDMVRGILARNLRQASPGSSTEASLAAAASYPPSSSSAATATSPSPLIGPFPISPSAAVGPSSSVGGSSSSVAEPSSTVARPSSSAGISFPAADSSTVKVSSASVAPLNAGPLSYVEASSIPADSLSVESPMPAGESSSAWSSTSAAPGQSCLAISPPTASGLSPETASSLRAASVSTTDSASAPSSSIPKPPSTVASSSAMPSSSIATSSSTVDSSSTAAFASTPTSSSTTASSTTVNPSIHAHLNPPSSSSTSVSSSIGSTSDAAAQKIQQLESELERMRQDLAGAVHLNKVKDEQIKINRLRADKLLNRDLKRCRDELGNDDMASLIRVKRHKEGGNSSPALSEHGEAVPRIKKDGKDEDKHVKDGIQFDAAKLSSVDDAAAQQRADDHSRAAKLIQFAVTTHLPHIKPHAVQATAVGGAQVAVAKGWERSTFRAMGLSILERMCSRSTGEVLKSLKAGAAARNIEIDLGMFHPPPSDGALRDVAFKWLVGLMGSIVELDPTSNLNMLFTIVGIASWHRSLWKTASVGIAYLLDRIFDQASAASAASPVSTSTSAEIVDQWEQKVMRLVGADVWHAIQQAHHIP